MESENASKSCILIYGGHIEMGWMLQFIARARYTAQSYDHVVVHCEEPFPYLYQDFANETITYPVKVGLRDRWLYKGEPPRYSKTVQAIHARLRAEYKEVKLFYPTEDRCKRPEAKWFKYGINCGRGMDNECEILIHARSLPRVNYDKNRSRNWPTEKWVEFVAKIIGHEMFLIGSKQSSRYIQGADDFRGWPLNLLCDIMASSKVIVGESSGPMHLAALCGCPQVVWTHKIKEKSLDGHTNRWRYEEGWNPFKTPVTVIDKYGWDPPVEVVAEAVKAYL